MTFFDEQPDGDPHGECAAEIKRLREALEEAHRALRDVADHAPGTPGLHYDSLELLVASATGIAAIGRDDALAALNSNNSQTTSKP